MRSVAAEPEIVSDLLNKVVLRCLSTDAGRTALKPLVPTIAVLAGSLARSDQDEDGGWMSIKRCSVSGRDKARKVVEVLVLRPHPDLARASALLPSQRFASAGHHNDWDWLALFGDIHRTGTPLERPRRAFALASLLKQLRLSLIHI